MKQLDSDYVARYEYACSLVAKFLDREIGLTAFSKEDKLFDNGSIPQILFTADYSTLHNTGVKTQMENHLTRLSKDEGTYLLARVHGVVLDFYSILGEEFVEQLIKNTAHGIAAAGGRYKDKKLIEELSTTLHNHLELLVFIMGNKVYQDEFLRRKTIKATLSGIDGQTRK